jgi:uncharacterized membrane protein (Fun14 family)
MASTVEPYTPPPAVDRHEEAPAKRRMSRGSKIAIAVATLLLLIGIVLKLVEPDAPPTTAGTAGAANLVDGQGKPIAGQTQEEGSDWAPGFLKMGFSFFVCFAIGYAARKFLKIGLVVFGVMFAFLFLASYLGYVDIDTTKMSTDWDKFIANAKTQFDSLRAFVTGSLPAAGMGALGLFTGFKAG